MQKMDAKNTKNNLFEDFDIERVKFRERLNKILSIRITRTDFEWKNLMN